MAMGRAVVSTTIGAEGLDVHDGRNIILADNPAKFADTVAELLVNDGLRGRYERAAAELAAKYDWPAVGQRFGEVLQQLVGLSKEACSPVEVVSKATNPIAIRVGAKKKTLRFSANVLIPIGTGTIMNCLLR